MDKREHLKKTWLMNNRENKINAAAEILHQL